MGGAGRGHFCFAKEPDGSAVLLLSDDRKAMSAAAKARRSNGPYARGQVRWSSKGYLEFRTKDTFDGFIAVLAGWVKAHRVGAAGLSALVGARMTQLDDEGETVARFKDAEAWE
jgi:hypothetical protein